MALTIGMNVPIFDLEAIQRGDVIRIRRAKDTMFRNGIVTRIDNNQMQILFANVQNNATSFMTVDAVDVAIGVWEIRWSTDLITVNYNPSAEGSGGA